LVDYPVQGLDLSKYVINPELPEALDSSSEMKDENENKAIYDLIGVSNHMGSTGGGHYTAYCK
jgi:ubiquitin C-terminal hydrolase